MTPDQHATMVLTWIGLGALGIGTLAMILRWLFSRRGDIAAVAGAVREDVKRGDGWQETARVMSRRPAETTIEDPQNRGLAKPDESGLQGLATGRNDANDPLAGQALGAAPANDLGDITPAEARAIIRQQARAEAIVAILKAAESGKVKSAGDQAGLIEAVSGAARTSRPGSPYTHLKTVVDDLRGKPKPQYRDLDEHKRPAELSPAPAE